MVTYFLDSSTLVKRVVRDTGSAWVESLFALAQAHDVFVVSLARVEVVAAITRRARAGSLSSDDASTACAQFETDLAADCQTVEATETLITRDISPNSRSARLRCHSTGSRCADQPDVHHKWPAAARLCFRRH